ncbi:MAG: ribonuclease PH [Alphaproteobacteria bacterium]|nr:ribonuclease PH [Alphaproteobacteria bacterium]
MNLSDRPDGRARDAMRPVSMQAGYYPHAEGSCWIKMGATEVLAVVSVEDSVPRFMRGQGAGWLTAEYSMLPRSTKQRVDRRSTLDGGRTKEISRLIGRSLRAVTPLEAVGEVTLRIDCDVIVADGGTRTASITAASVAVAMALEGLRAPRPSSRRRKQTPLAGLPTPAPAPFAGAVALSVGQFGDNLLLDPNYAEDERLNVDANFVFTTTGQLIDVGFSVEGTPCDAEVLPSMLALARTAVPTLAEAQRAALDAETS